jgi:hypothetical protein
MKAHAAIEMRDVERLMLRALEFDRTADAAADVYEALGVVYNVSRDYVAAADAIRRWTTSSETSWGQRLPTIISPTRPYRHTVRH